MATGYKSLSFAGKVRFWVVTIAIVVIVSVIAVPVFRGDPIKANGEGLGFSGGIEVGQIKK